MMLQVPSIAGSKVGASPVIIVGAVNGRAAAQDAIAAVGSRLVACLNWEDAPEALECHLACAVLVIETEGVEVNTLAAWLPRLDMLATTLDIPVVISLESEAIDVVAATMLSATTQMLCSPSIVDRIVALTIATRQSTAMSVHDAVREGESARLQKLNDEVARIADILARLTRRGPDEAVQPSIVSDPSTPFRQDHPSDVTIDAAEVRRAIRARRLRGQHFGSGLFEDPAWDILLDLFAAELEGSQVSVSSLCIAASVAPTTALRWITRLTDSGLLERHADPFDRRRAFLELSPAAARAMRNHVAALRRAGLPFG